MEVEWKVPLRSAHVHLMEIHERKYSMSSCGHFYLRPNKHPSTPLHKHDSHLLPHKFILSNEPPVLPLYICDYGIFHLRPQKLPFTPMGSNIVRTPFELLPPSSFPFQKAPSTSRWHLFLRKLLFISDITFIYSHPTMFLSFDGI